MAQFAVEGFASIAQNYITGTVASNFYPRLPFVSAMAAFTISRNPKTSVNIGRPDGDKLWKSQFLHGGTVTPAMREQIDTANAIEVPIQRFETSNSKWLGARDTNPTVASATTLSHGQARQAAALFYRASYITPILIWESDLERAARKETARGFAIAQGKLIDDATEVAYQEHIKGLNTGIWSGNPTNQSADPWNSPLGVDQLFSTTNTYGNVNRSISGNSVWAAQVDSTLTSVDAAKLVNDVNVTKGITDLNGRGTDLIITTKAIYLQMKEQLKAQGPVGIRVVNEGLPGMAELGVRQEVLLVDNTYIMYDATQTANYAYCFDMSTMFMAFPNGKACKVTEFTDLQKYGEGAKRASQAFIETELFFWNANPALNVAYKSLGT